ncbi:unnamed protein product [Durusdinium trenchii]|uniref:Uncharacterized protein n=1 Tax=Durusdinium trenchii TaxID=1381693 RepID=A0ABP0JLW0_9DINO
MKELFQIRHRHKRQGLQEVETNAIKPPGFERHLPNGIPYVPFSERGKRTCFFTSFVNQLLKAFELDLFCLDLPYGTASGAEAQVAQVAQAAQAAQTAQAAQAAQAVQAAQTAQAAQAAQTAPAAQAAQVAQTAQTAQTAQAAQKMQSAQAAQVAQTAQVAQAAPVAQVLGFRDGLEMNAQADLRAASKYRWRNLRTCGQAHLELRSLDEAKEDFERARELEPDPAIDKELKRLRQAFSQHDAKVWLQGSFQFSDEVVAKRCEKRFLFKKLHMACHAKQAALSCEVGGHPY